MATLMIAGMFAACSPPASSSTPDLGGPGEDMANNDNFPHWPAGPAPLEIKMPTVMLGAGKEIDDTWTTTLPNATPVWIYNITWNSSPGLHHSRVDINETGLAFTLAVGQTTGGQEFPSGYAMQLPAQSKITISYHYINAMQTDAPIDITVKFYPVADQSASPTPISFVPMLYLPINLPAHETKEVTSTCALPQDVELHALLSHIHARGRHVQASIVGGENDGMIIYSTDLWDNAPVDQYRPTIKLKKGDSIRYSCKWQNDTDSTIMFGQLAGDEMCGVGAWMSPVNLGLNAAVVAENGPCTFQQQ